MKRTLKASVMIAILFAFISTTNVFAQLTGTKTIGPAGDYTTIEAAITDLNLQGTAAPGVTFLIASGYYTPAASLSITTLTGSATAPIEFRPAPGASVQVDVVGGATGPAWGLADGVTYCTLNGSNTGSGTDRSMKVYNITAGGNIGLKGFGRNVNCAFKNIITRTGANTGVNWTATACRGIDIFYTTTESNNFLIDNCQVSSAGIGIRVEGNSTTPLLFGIILRNNTIDSCGVNGILNIYNISAQVYNNTVSCQLGTGTGVVGISMGTANSGNFRCYNNKVFNVKSSSTSATLTSFIAGINSLSTNALNNRGGAIFNNFVWDINYTAATGNAPVAGIWFNTGSTLTNPDTVAYNSVNLTGSNAANRVSAAFAYTATTVTNKVLLLNNIFSNTMVSGTSATIGIFKSTLATIMTSNYNDLYVGPTNATTLTGRIVAVDYQSLGNWRTGSGGDLNSIAENPPFTSATNLHIPDGTATQLESGGIPINSTNLDIDGTTRNVTTPDIGADEFNGIPVDLTGPTITYTALTNTANTTDRSLTATITDVSGVAGGANIPRLYYKKSTEGAYHFDNAPTVLGNNYTWTLSAAAMGGLAPGDIVQYYVAAQDTPGNLSTSPSGGSGTNPPGTTAPGAPAVYNITAPPLSGTYTVGTALFNRVTGKNITFEERTRIVTKTVPVYAEATIEKSEKSAETTGINAPTGKQLGTQEVTTQERYSVMMENGREYTGETSHLFTQAERSNLGLSPDMAGVYLTITAAVSDYNLRGVSGNSIFSLTDAAYPGETYPITFNNTSENVSSSITLKPAIGVTPTISGALNSGALIKILSNYVIIDGSNTVGGTTKDMSISNTSVTGPSVVLIGSTGTTYIDGVTVKSCVITNGINTSTAVIVSDGTVAGSAGYFTNISIFNNTIQKAYIGLYLIANNASVSYATVSTNIMSSVGVDQIRFTGIYMQALNGANLRYNVFSNFEGLTAEDDNGIWAATDTKNSIIENNYIQSLKYTGTGGYGTHGVQMSSGVLNCNNVIRNNTIADLSGDGWASSILGDNTHGIYLFGNAQTGAKIYNNSIQLNGNTLNQTGAMSYGITLATNSTADVRNNAIINNLGLLAATGLGSTCMFVQSSNAQLEFSDNNDYFCNATGIGLKDIGRIAAVDYFTLPAYSVATTKDKNSVSGDPAFPTLFNNNPDVTNPNCWVLNGTGYPGLTTADLNGQPRSAGISSGTCDIGAFEFTPTVGVPAASQTGVIGAGNTTTYFIFGRTIAAITWGAAGTYPGTLTATFNSGTPPPSIPGGARYGFGYWEFIPNVQPSGGATYDMTIYFDDGQTGTVVTPATNLILAKYNGSVWKDYQPGAGAGQSNLNYVDKSILVTGLTSFSIFALTDAVAPLPVELASFTSTIDHRNVELKWSTAAELNNSGFDVERKISGTSTWSKVGNVAGHGTSNVTNNYSFSERNLPTANYNYRLKQIDNNGNFKYYDLSNEVIIGVPTAFSISQNYPNPFNPTTKINYDLPFDSKVSIVLFDMTGRQVAELLNTNVTAGYQTVSFNASNLSSGTYFYQINANGGSQSFSKTMKMMLVK